MENCNHQRYQDQQQWISASIMWYNKIIQPLNTHTAYHDNKTSKLCHNLSYDVCVKCRRNCCLSCFIVRVYDDSYYSKSFIYCKQCMQISHQRENCDYIHGIKCTQCQKENVCIKCGYIHIYNKLNGTLASRQCYECHPLIQYQLIFIITKAMFNSSSKTMTDINILKLITNYAFNSTLHCQYENCCGQLSLSPILNNKPSDLTISRKGIICTNIDTNYVLVCYKHSWLHIKEQSIYYDEPGYESLINTVDSSYTNKTKLRCGTINSYHYPENTANNCYHCKGEICMECDKVIKCTECEKVCHDKKCDFQDYIVLCEDNNHYKQSIQCKDCYSAKAYRNELNIIKIICQSMITSMHSELNTSMNENIIELITKYYYTKNLTLQFLVGPLTQNTIKNNSWCIDDESGYFAQITKLKLCRYGKHGHLKIFFKMIIPYTGQISDKMIRRMQLKSLQRCVIDDTVKYIFIKYVDGDKKLVECEDEITGETVNINISPLEKYYTKVTDLIDAKKENDKVILSVIKGPRSTHHSELEQLELVQCIFDAKIDTKTVADQNMICID